MPRRLQRPITSAESPTAALLPSSRSRHNICRSRSPPPPPQQPPHSAPNGREDGRRGKQKPGGPPRAAKRAARKSTTDRQRTHARALQLFCLRGLGSSVSGMLRMARAFCHRYLGEATHSPKSYSFTAVAEPYFSIPVAQPPVATAF